MAKLKLGLRKISPTDNAARDTLDIIAIHGLGTESPRTWEYNLWMKVGKKTPQKTQDYDRTGV